MPNLHIFGLEFENNIFMIQITVLKFVLLQSFVQKIKIPKCVIRNALLEYFLAGILKNYCHIWNQHLRISVIAKFCKETRIPTFGIKNTLFGYFYARILEKLFSYLKSAPSNLSICKIS